MEYKIEQININEFLYLTRLVDSCIDSFLSGDSPELCCKHIDELADEYGKNLLELKALELKLEAKELFVKYFKYLKKYGEITSNMNGDNLNYVCQEYMYLRNKVIVANSNMLSKHYLELEKNIIRQLQAIGKKVNIIEKTNNNKKSK